MSLRASGMGLAYAVGSLGRIAGVLGLALIVGSSDLLKPQATPAAIEPALLLSVGWFALCGLIFVFLAFETKGRSIEQIDARCSRSRRARTRRPRFRSDGGFRSRPRR